MSIPNRKVVISAAGGPEVVSVQDSELPAPKKGEVRVKLLYSVFGGSDINMRNGTYPMQEKAPLTTGYVSVGVVDLNGKDSHKLQPGDLVCCLSVYGGQQYYTNLPEPFIVPVPKGIRLDQAAAMVLDWTTAYGMAFRTAKLQKGHKVFVHGLSGSVGNALLQLCKIQGAEVYGTASESQFDALRAQGAHPFVYTNKDWIQAMKDMGGAHAVFDPLGFESFDESWSILSRDNGHLIGYGSNGASLNGKPRSQAAAYADIAKLMARKLVPFCPFNASFFYVDRTQSTFVPELLKCFDLQVKGEVDVKIKKTISLEEVPQMHKDWTKTKGVGTVVVKLPYADEYLGGR
ncbi:GroES-like protein [Aaosphaeria arxii CBS 175.79]|uniref:GroES-like protein n=1 Tax=Aaosphaeria arxii CBS 175.79 TaxID=1450172 RepID=A0A6A5XB88_9PLEO|nr:GroES-like protein [Aaosphaeria arxii CBS 175.79]KAF2010169.1 GroES-like protein [Aaosphaeria arxii CBS 175.79]